MIYFTPDAPPEYAAAGISGNRAGYFASRSAALGAATSDLVFATFFNFHPTLVHASMRDVWSNTTPTAMLDARLRAVDVSLRRAFDDDLLASSELADVAELARRAALVACEHPEGRPLFAAHAGLSWPDDVHLVLWHAQTLLREFRGDGHIGALVAEGLGGLDALIAHAATGEVPAEALRLTRAWSAEEWSTGIESLRERGLVDGDGSFTDAGRAQREGIEATTDRVSLAPYAAIGADGCASVRKMGRRLTELVLAAGLLIFDLDRLDDRER